MSDNPPFPPEPAGSGPAQPPLPPPGWQQAPPPSPYSTPAAWPQMPASPPHAPGSSYGTPPGLSGDFIWPQATIAPTQKPKRSNKLVIGIGSLVSVALIGLGTATLMSNGAGAASPEEAVEQFAAAIDGEDLLGAMATLAPDEVRSLPDVYRLSLKKSQELGVADVEAPTTDEPRLDGLNLSVSGLKVNATQLSEDIAKVQILDGKIASEVKEGSDLAESLKSLGWMFGGGLDGEYEDALFECVDQRIDVDADEDEWDEAYQACEAELESDSAGDESSFGNGELDLGELRQKARSHGGPGLFVMAVRRDGGWYLSPFFTLAEYLRMTEFDGEEIDFDGRDPGPAAADPTAAVMAMIKGIENGDSHAFADALASEVSVWRVYCQLADTTDSDNESSTTSEDGGNATDSIVGAASQLKLADISLAEEKIDETRVRVIATSFKIEGQIEEVDTESDAYIEYLDCEYRCEDYEDLPTVTHDVTYSLADGCFSATEDAEVVEEGCLNDVEGGILQALDINQVSVVAVAERDGWAVSPIESLADYLSRIVANLTRPILERYSSELGLFPFGASSDEAPETTQTITIGSNTVKLNEAGVAFVDVDTKGAVLATATTNTEDVTISVLHTSSDEEDSDYGSYDTYGGSEAMAIDGAVLRIVGRIEDRTAIVNLEALKAQSIQEEVEIIGDISAGDVIAYELTAEQYLRAHLQFDGSTWIEVYNDKGDIFDTYEIDQSDPDSMNQQLILTFNRAVEDEDNQEADSGPEELDPSYESSGSGILEDGQYGIYVPTERPGFSRVDPNSAVVRYDLSDYSYSTEPFQVLGGSAVAVTITSPESVSVAVYCDSSDSSEDVDLIPGEAGTVYVLAEEDEVCSIELYWYGDEEDEPGDRSGTADITMTWAAVDPALATAAIEGYVDNDPFGEERSSRGIEEGLAPSTTVLEGAESVPPSGEDGSASPQIPSTTLPES